MRKSVLCGVLLLLFGKMVSAQQTLSLQECRDLAVKNNKELRIAEEKIRMADYEKKAALTKYFPQISAVVECVGCFVGWFGPIAGGTANGGRYQ